MTLGVATTQTPPLGEKNSTTMILISKMIRNGGNVCYSQKERTGARMLTPAVQLPMMRTILVEESTTHSTMILIMRMIQIRVQMMWIILFLTKS